MTMDEKHRYKPRKRGRTLVDVDETQKIPNPGSDEAKAMGCLCPVFDNNHGRGYFSQRDMFVFNYNCPVHKDWWQGEKAGGDPA